MSKKIVLHLDDSLYKRCFDCMKRVHSRSHFSDLPCPPLSEFLPLMIEYACLGYEFEVFGKELDIDAE